MLGTCKFDSFNGPLRSKKLNPYVEIMPVTCCQRLKLLSDFHETLYRPTLQILVTQRMVGENPLNKSHALLNIIVVIY